MSYLKLKKRGPLKLISQNLFMLGTFRVNSMLELTSGLNLLVGPNGIGKSSLIHFIKLHQKDLFPALSVAFMDQLPLAPLSDLRAIDVWQILKETMSHMSNSRWESLVQEFAFEKKLTQPIQTLSGGENQILKFILMYSQQADIYFLDEPSQYLDSENWEKVQKKILQALDKTWLIIEHRPEVWHGHDYTQFMMDYKAKDIVITKEFSHARN
jgi:translation initiation factor RLI1